MVGPSFTSGETSSQVRKWRWGKREEYELEIEGVGEWKRRGRVTVRSERKRQGFRETNKQRHRFVIPSH